MLHEHSAYFLLEIYVFNSLGYIPSNGIVGLTHTVL